MNLHLQLAHEVGIAIALAVIVLAIVVDVIGIERGKRKLAALRIVTPWIMLGALGTAIGYGTYRYLKKARGTELIEWRSPHAIWIGAGAILVALVAFHLHRRRVAALGFSQVSLIRRSGIVAWISDLPAVLRALAIAALAVALTRPETYRTLKHEEDTIDIMIVFDMSKSMEETDMPRDRMDAAQRVVRRFLRRTTHDRVGLVIFGQQAMLQCPLTQDAKLVEQIVRDLVIGDVPALGTAIGDGLGLALAQLRRSDGLCDPASTAPDACPADHACTKEGYCKSPKSNKVVILLSDGDSNWATRFEPDEAARAAKEMGVKVYTVLVGRENGDFLGFGGSVNPATLRSMASVTGGDFFRATDHETFERGFDTVRQKLDKTKRIREERIPDKQLFLPLAVLALILFGLDLLLSHTRFRRLP